jgi:signal transduction histidine kinase/CheY-like chemotaxis protein
MTVRQKILVPMLTLTIVSSASVLLSSIMLFKQDLDSAASQRLHVAAMSAESEFRRYATASYKAARGFARDKDLIAAIQTHDRRNVLATATKLQDAASADFCVVFDNKGTDIARTHDPGRYGDSAAHLSHIKEAMRGGMQTLMTPGIAHRLSVVTGAPVYDGQEQMIGIVAVGFRLDTHAFVASLKNITGCEVSIFSGDERVATTLWTTEGKSAVGTKADADVSAVVLTGRPYTGKVKVLGRESLVKYTPLFGAPDEVVGMAYVGESTVADARKIADFFANGVLITLTILAVSAAVALFVAKLVDERLTGMMKRQAEAEAASLAKSTFLTRMSHEIRTPMNAIMGITELQMYDDTLPAETQEALSKIHVAGDTLLKIINNILDLSKIEAGKIELTPSAYEVASLLNDAMQLTVLLFESKPIDFELLVDAATPTHLYGDELRIRQVLNNVLSNAFKYTESGKVSLSVRTEAGAEDREIMLVLRVSDTGQGMTPEQIERLFDEYSRFNPETNRAITGTGLGMAITQHLVSLMKGTITVESEPGRGSSFTVRLAQKDVEAEAMGEELAADLKGNTFSCLERVKKAQIAREPMPYASVLVVDDVETNLYVAKLLLTPYRLQVDTAANGAQAVEKIKGGKTYDLVFMDHMMPVMNGIEATAQIRRLGYQRPIVALTANALVGHAELFLQSGFNAFLAKPIDARELNALLNHMIRDKQPPEVLEAARRTARSAPAKIIKDPATEEQLAKHFVRDAEKTLEALQKLLEKHEAYDENDFETYTINTHSMKSVLALIGKPRLSEISRMLEAAGRARDAATIAARTPAFLEELRVLVAKHGKREEDSGENDAYDESFVRERLLVIQKACVDLNKKRAKTALAELAKQALPRRVHEQLDEITHLLLVSNFEEAAKVTESMLPDAPHG